MCVRKEREPEDLDHVTPPPKEASSHRWCAAAGVREQGLPCLMLLLSGDQLLFIFPSPPGARQQTRDGARGERNIRGTEGSVGQQGGGGMALESENS